jgi:hypothetical protein
VTFSAQMSGMGRRAATKGDHPPSEVPGRIGSGNQSGSGRMRGGTPGAQMTSSYLGGSPLR